MRIKLETLELKLTQITTNANATITNTSLSTGTGNSAAELSDGSWSVVDHEAQSSASSSDTNQRQSEDGKHTKGQQRRKRRNRKQNKQNKQKDTDQSVAKQMSAMQDFTNTIGKQETLISLLMADPPMRKVLSTPPLHYVSYPFVGSKTLLFPYSRVNATHPPRPPHPPSSQPRSARPTRPTGSYSAPSPSSKAARVARSYSRRSVPPRKPHARCKLRYVHKHNSTCPRNQDRAAIPLLVKL